MLNLGHVVPWAGHLGNIRVRTALPDISSGQAYEQTEPSFVGATLSLKRLQQVPSRDPIQPLPIISTPFEHLGMDIVGPMERSQSGNRFMLVITDYATKYPEVFPLKSIKVRHLLLARVGLRNCEEQSTNSNPRHTFYVHIDEAGVSAARY